MLKPAFIALLLALLPLAPDRAVARRPSAPPAELVVIARLVERPHKNLPHCGILHVAEAMRYQVIRVERGKLTARTIWVAHGCPEMSRTTYNGRQAGTLQSFKIGDTHRLALTRNPPAGPGGPSIIAPKGIVPWWTLRADPSR